MSIKEIITTIVGGFLFPFFIVTTWGRLVKKIGPFGGFVASFIIVGTMWVINHGVNNHLVKQSGLVWIDMAWAAAIGVLVSSIVTGGKVYKSMTTIVAVILGGLLSGGLLFLI